MPTLEIDGKTIEMPAGSTVMDAATRLGIFVPHFCYHRKLSIAANCRMCLVQVEKAPKPLPACATPIAEGMKVWTHSEQAKKAQASVMEFLLINHPLDCPICDQGGECQLQDLAVGYGGSATRYADEKRVVLHKSLGPLISAEEMTRCIQCTRCVRFGQEIAGVMELGMIGRGEHSEIVAFVGSTVDSELSGNMIDICPVGALTSRPFRYSARTWELARRRSVSPHDGLGANLIAQVRHDRVMRVVPFENEELNECWLSDRDRFSYEGLNSADRLNRPMLKEGGVWREVGWDEALSQVANGVSAMRSAHGAAAIGALASPHSTLEELFLLQKLARALGSDNVDFRLRQGDFSADGRRAGAPWLGMKVAELDALDRVLVVGSFLRKDHPLIANRIRQAARRGTQVSVIHAAGDELAMPLANRAVVRPLDLPRMLAEVVRALADAAGKAPPPALSGVSAGAQARAIAASLASGKNSAVLLGNFAQQHPQAAQIELLAHEIAALAGARRGFLGEAANSVGGYIAGCLPRNGGLNARTMLESPRKAYLLLGCEPALDCGDPRAAAAALAQADLVVALGAFRGAAPEYATALLPIAPFTETSGSFVNTEGRLQGFNGVVRPAGETRPGWKVLRVLANRLGLAGFDHESSEAVRAEALAGGEIAGRLDNRVQGLDLSAPADSPAGLQRIAEVPIYFADPLVRRAGSLQRTRDARLPRAAMNSATIARLALAVGATVRVAQGGGEARLELECDDGLPDGAVRVAAAHESTAGLGAMFGELRVERA